MNVTKNIGMLLLAVWLILTGLLPLLNVGFSGMGTVMAVLAIGSLRCALDLSAANVGYSYAAPFLHARLWAQHTACLKTWGGGRPGRLPFLERFSFRLPNNACKKRSARSNAMEILMKLSSIRAATSLRPLCAGTRLNFVERARAYH